MDCVRKSIIERDQQNKYENDRLEWAEAIIVAHDHNSKYKRFSRTSFGRYSDYFHNNYIEQSRSKLQLSLLYETETPLQSHLTCKSRRKWAMFSLHSRSCVNCVLPMLSCEWFRVLFKLLPDRNDVRNFFSAPVWHHVMCTRIASIWLSFLLFFYSINY